MGALATDTAVIGESSEGQGRYTADVSRDWEIWGPNGGYLAAIALRAVGAHTGRLRPASISVQERLDAAGRGDEPPRFRFWDNFEGRPLDWIDDWEQRVAGEPQAGGWYRFAHQETSSDPWVDAGRSAILVDTFTWPAATRASTGDLPFIAPSLDLNVQLLHDVADSPWLLALGQAPVAHRGTIGCYGRVWSADGRLAAMGTGTCLCTPVRS